MSASGGYGAPAAGSGAPGGYGAPGGAPAPGSRNYNIYSRLPNGPSAPVHTAPGSAVRFDPLLGGAPGGPPAGVLGLPNPSPTYGAPTAPAGGWYTPADHSASLGTGRHIPAKPPGASGWYNTGAAAAQAEAQRRNAARGTASSFMKKGGKRRTRRSKKQRQRRRLSRRHH